MATGSFLGGLAGGAIGSATVQLYLDDKTYKASLASAEASTKAGQRRIQKSYTDLKASAGIALAALAAGVVAFGKASVEAAIESERVLSQLQVQVGANTAAYEEQATALQALTGVSDESIISAQTLLSRFELTEEQVRSAIPVILDYAQAMGVSVETAASSVGRALLGNARALKSVGIDYTATGDRAADFTTVLEALTQKVGGSAEAFGKTAAGQMAIFAQQLDELKETLGAALIPILVDTVETLGDVVEAFHAAADAVNFLGDAIGNVLPDLPDFGGALGDIGETLDTIFTGTLPKVLQGAKDAFFDLTDALTITENAGPSGFGNSVEQTAEQIGDAWTGTADKVDAAFDRYARDLRRGEDGIRNFADMTDQELASFTADFEQSFQETFNVLGRFTDQFDLTTRQLVQNVRQAARQGERYKSDLERLGDLDIPEDLASQLIGDPGALRAFISGTAGDRQQIKAAFQDIQDSGTGAGSAVDTMLGLVNDIPPTKKMNVVVEFSYPGYRDDIRIPGVGT